jgi:hypothetical protein
MQHDVFDFFVFGVGERTTEVENRRTDLDLSPMHELSHKAFSTFSNRVPYVSDILLATSSCILVSKHDIETSN